MHSIKVTALFLLSFPCICRCSAANLHRRKSTVKKPQHFDTSTLNFPPSCTGASGGRSLAGESFARLNIVAGGAIENNESSDPLRSIRTSLGVASILSWMTVSYSALSSHPTPSVDAACGFRHNAFTIAQAWAFPVPVLASTISVLHKSVSPLSAISRRLNLALTTASLWTAAAVFFGPKFSVGYDLFSSKPFILYGCSIVHILTAVVTLASWSRSIAGNHFSRIVRGCTNSFFDLLSPDTSKHNDSLYALGSLGLFVLTLLPQLVAFPTATIPTLLGKRLSRAASGFTWLGSVGAYCLLMNDSGSSNEDQDASRVLRRGLGIGSAAHLALVIAKIVGLDGGGLLLAGNGLKEYYPSLVGASGAASFTMILTYLVLAFACL